MLNSNGEIREPNKAALRFFGVEQAEIEGKDFFSFQAKNDEVISKNLAQRFKLNIPINREETIMIDKNGKSKWIQLSIFDMQNPASKTRTGLATIVDITELKQLDRAKTEFVSIASHQLRTPLATVKWYTDMMLSGGTGELSEKQKDYVSRLYNVNEDMIDLVETLLNVSRIEIGKLPIERKPTNVENITQSVLEELAPQIAKMGLKIEGQYNGLLQNVESDPKLLRIVIQNLISNAVKYTPQGGTITISFEESSNEKMVVVADTGYGIPKEDQDRIFGKLFRAGNVVKMASSQGTGLGLYLTKSLMEMLGGTISFKSEENKGSVFIITL
jgi:PAS domain S-box-containing protein